jgi:hypothetical protein
MTPPPPQRSFLTRIFLSPGEPRLRAGWRILVHLLAAAVLIFAFSALLGLVFFSIPEPPYAWLVIANQVAYFLTVTVSVYLARRFLDRRTFASLGLVANKRAILDVLAGILIAGILIGLVYLAELAGGWLRFEGFAWQEEAVSGVMAGVLLDLFLFIVVGWVEELITRGYWLRNLTDGLNLPWAVIITSSLFALLHLGNPNASWIIVLGLTAAGLFFAFAALRSGQLWLPIGLHIGWNFFEGTVFGFPVSGSTSYRLIHQTISGPELITGGAFGPEAGAVLFPVLLVGVALIYLYTRLRKGGE